jgi:DNA-binding transcriptional MerR regulator
MELTVGEAARRANLTPKAVRLYEARGLLTAVARTHAGYRIYTDEDVRLLRFIAQARGLGLGLPEIHRLVELRRGGIPPSREVLAILDSHLKEIDRRLSDLGELRSGLSDVFDAARSAVHNGDDVRLCRIIVPRDHSAASEAQRSLQSQERRHTPDLLLDGRAVRPGER